MVYFNNSLVVCRLFVFVEYSPSRMVEVMLNRVQVLLHETNMIEYNLLNNNLFVNMHCEEGGRW